MEKNDFIEKVNRKVSDEIYQYFREYTVLPVFVKMPYNVFKELELIDNVFNSKNLSKETIVRYNGLICCPTFAIEDVNEIEVF